MGDKANSKRSKGEPKGGRVVRSGKEGHVEQNGPLTLHMVPDRKRSTTTMALQDRQVRGPVLPVWSSGTIRKPHSMVVRTAQLRTQPEPHQPHKRRALARPGQPNLGPQQRCRGSGRGRRPASGRGGEIFQLSGASLLDLKWVCLFVRLFIVILSPLKSRSRS